MDTQARRPSLATAVWTREREQTRWIPPRCLVTLPVRRGARGESASHLSRVSKLLIDRIGTASAEIQATTGPGNLSKAIFECGTTSGIAESELVILRDWDSLAVSRWPLSHRGDARNWRQSNQQRFHGSDA